MLFGAPGGTRRRSARKQTPRQVDRSHCRLACCCLHVRGSNASSPTLVTSCRIPRRKGAWHLACFHRQARRRLGLETDPPARRRLGLKTDPPARRRLGLETDPPAVLHTPHVAGHFALTFAP